ncbi:MAG: MFS transporter [Hylemonella sp.]
MPEPQASKRLPAGVWALGFVSLLMDVSSEMIHSLLPVFLVTGLGVSMLSVGLLEGAAEATALMVRVFSGSLSDWWGRRKPLAVIGYGLGAATKPLFALASSIEPVIAARLIDRIGKGIRAAPRDALVADIAPPQLRGAAFGLRQSLDTFGAFLGPLLAMALMLMWSNDFQAVFWVATIPAFLCVAVLVLGVREPPRESTGPRINPLQPDNLRRLSPDYWWVVGLGAVFTLARFSEAFLVLQAEQGGLNLAWVPLVLIVMNFFYALGAYPCGALADRMSHRMLLAIGLVLLIGADLLLALDNRGPMLWGGIVLWGLHMAMTQGLLATMVADTAVLELRATAFGIFNLISGLAMLVASALAGLLWDLWGAPAAFLAGIFFSLLALLLLIRRKSAHPAA